MARHIILSNGQTRARLHHAGFPKSSKYDAVAKPVDALKPDEALFVSIPGADGDPRLIVVRLAGGLRARFRGVVTLKDFDRGGVWVYRPAVPAAGGGRAIGPHKEAEIMRRRLDSAQLD